MEILAKIAMVYAYQSWIGIPRDGDYGLQRASSSSTREPGAYGAYYGEETTHEDELRGQRSEEELRAGTREREPGALNVRKRVRTEREQMEVPIPVAKKSQ